MDSARAGEPEGMLAGRGVGHDGPLEAEDAPVALGDLLDDLHSLLVRLARAYGDGLPDALPARLALFVEAAVKFFRA